MPVKLIVVCQRCGERFERKPRSSPKYCTACGVIVNREKTRARKDTIEADLIAKRDLLRQILEPMSDYLTDDMVITAKQYIDSLGPSDDGIVPLVNDQMPSGTESPGGADEGVSTTSETLAVDLDARRVEAIMHDWHAEHPGWWTDQT